MNLDVLEVILRGAFHVAWERLDQGFVAVAGDIKVEVAPSHTLPGSLSITFTTARMISHRSAAHADEVPRIIRLLVEDNLVKDPCNTDYRVWIGADRVLQILGKSAQEAQQRLDKALCEVRYAEAVTARTGRALAEFKERHGL